MMDKRLLRETKAVRFFLALSVGLGLGAGLLAIMQAGYLARAVNGVFLAGRSLSAAWLWLWPLLGIIIFRAGMAWTSEIAAHRVAAQIKHTLRQRFLDHLLALGPVYAGGEQTGELVNVLVELNVKTIDIYCIKCYNALNRVFRHTGEAPLRFTESFSI